MVKYPLKTTIFLIPPNPSGLHYRSPTLLIRCILLILFISFTSTICLADYSNGWSYNVYSDVTNNVKPYQMKLFVSNAVGTNNNSFVFCNGHCKSDFADIRFSLENTQDLKYWLDTSTNPNSVWVNVTGTGRVYMYYGNPSAQSESNGQGTFYLFDNFDDGNYNSNPIWTVVQGTWSTVYQYLEITSSGTPDEITTPVSIDTWALKFNVERIDSVDGAYIVQMIQDTRATGYGLYATGSDNGNIFSLEKNGGTIINGSTWSSDTGNHVVEITRTQDNWIAFYLDGVLKGRSWDNTITSFNKLEFESHSNANKHFDNISVRRYYSNDPYWFPTWSSESSEPLDMSAWSNHLVLSISNGVRPTQISLNVHDSSGTNTLTDVYIQCEATNCLDTRFLLDDTTQLNYWWEKYPSNGQAGKVWVNLTGNGQVYMYYGNPSASYEGDGSLTFPVFYDLRGLSSFPSGWSLSGTVNLLSNGITVNYQGYALTSQSYGYNTNTILDEGIVMPSSTGNAPSHYVAGFIGTGTVGSTELLGHDIYGSQSQTNGVIENWACLNSCALGLAFGTTGVVSLRYDTNNLYWRLNYGSESSYARNIGASKPIGISNKGATGDTVTNTPEILSWIRIRTYPEQEWSDVTGGSPPTPIGDYHHYINNAIPNGVRPMQISLNVHNDAQSASNTYTDVHIECESTNCADVRFLLNNNTVLNYWWETYPYNGQAGKVWVNVPSNGDITLAYGASGVSDIGSGSLTFPVFYDLRGLSSLPSGWVSSGTVSYYSNGITVNHGGHALTSQTYGYNTDTILDEGIVMPASTNNGNSHYVAGFIGTGTVGSTELLGHDIYGSQSQTNGVIENWACLNSCALGLVYGTTGVVSLRYNTNNLYWSKNYGSESSYSRDLGASLPIGISHKGGTIVNTPEILSWIRIRSYPEQEWNNWGTSSSNVITQSHIGNWNVNMGNTIQFTVSSTDQEGRTLTYGTNATKGTYVTNSGGSSSWSDVNVSGWVKYSGNPVIPKSSDTNDFTWRGLREIHVMRILFDNGSIGFRDTDGRYWVSYDAEGNQAQSQCQTSCWQMAVAYTYDFYNFVKMGSIIPQGNAGIIVKHGSTYYAYYGQGSDTTGIYVSTSTDISNINSWSTANSNNPIATPSVIGGSMTYMTPGEIVIDPADPTRYLMTVSGSNAGNGGATAYLASSGYNFASTWVNGGSINGAHTGIYDENAEGYLNINGIYYMTLNTICSSYTCTNGLYSNTSLDLHNWNWMGNYINAGSGWESTSIGMASWLYDYPNHTIYAYYDAGSDQTHQGRQIGLSTFKQYPTGTQQSSSATYTWTTVNGDGGNYFFNFYTSDGHGGLAQENISITVVGGTTTSTPTATPTASPTSSPTATIQIISMEGGFVLSSSPNNSLGQRTQITVPIGSSAYFEAHTQNNNSFWKWTKDDGTIVYTNTLSLTGITSDGSVTAWFNITPEPTFNSTGISDALYNISQSVYVGLIWIPQSINNVSQSLFGGLSAIALSINNVSVGILNMPSAINNVSISIQHVADNTSKNGLNGTIGVIIEGIRGDINSASSDIVGYAAPFGSDIISGVKSFTQGVGDAFLTIPQQMYNLTYTFIYPFIRFFNGTIKFITTGISDTLDFISAISDLGTEIMNFLRTSLEVIRGI